MYLPLNGNFTAAIDSSSFTANTGYQGGAVWIDAELLLVTILHSAFTNNSANPNTDGTTFASLGAGAAVWMTDTALSRTQSSLLRVLNSSFTGNNATSNTSTGASLSLGTVELDIKSSVFEGNYAGEFAGAIAMPASCNKNQAEGSNEIAVSNLQLQPLACSVNISRCQFTNNTAGQAAAAYLQLDGFIVTITDSSFVDNQAWTEDGAVALYVKPNSVGGVGSMVLLSGMLVQGNTVMQQRPSYPLASPATGAVWLDTLLCAAIVHSTFDGNEGVFGALYVNGLTGDPLTCWYQARNMTPIADFDLQPPLFDPLALQSLPTKPTTSLDVRSSLFEKTIGSAVFISNNDQFSAISSSVFSSNTATSSGGGVYIQDSGTIFVSDSKFSSQSAPLSGGAMYILGSHLQLQGSSIIGCSAPASGGGIYAAGSFISINRYIAHIFCMASCWGKMRCGVCQPYICEDLGNKCVLACFSKPATNCHVIVLYLCTICRSLLAGNTAGTQGGGAVIGVGCSHIHMEQTQLINNTSLDVEGAIKADADTLSVWLKSMNISRNRYGQQLLFFACSRHCPHIADGCCTNAC